MCVIFAASTGVIGATETVVGLLAIPVMLKYGYNKALISGTICAGGSLGTIIPPSVVVVVLGPVADVSIGDLLVGMMIPGLILACLYIVYILGLCLHPARGRAARCRPRPTSPRFVEKLQLTAARPGAADAADRRRAGLDDVRHRGADRGRGARRRWARSLLSIIYGRFSLAVAAASR